MPLFSELSRTSLDSFESESDSKESFNSLECGKNEKCNFFGELSRSSQDLLESESDSKESWDVWLNAPKVAFSFFPFVRHSISNQSINQSIESIEGRYANCLLSR